MTETSFSLEVKVEGYWNKQDNGRKVYVKGRTLKWVVDSDRFSLCELKNDLSEKLSWGGCQTPKTWMKDKNKETESLLESESQIPAMPHKSLWERLDLEFKVWPPTMKRPPGRPRKERIRGCLETSGQRQQCKRCKQYGHQARTCKVGEDDNSRVRKRKRPTEGQAKEGQASV